ncbi:hypothetical protein RCH18_003184 [Flavobacterium sp. PL11]|nr:hypothetical protein [Flavobacterium sp. PL11]
MFYIFVFVHGKQSSDNSNGATFDYRKYLRQKEKNYGKME